MFTNALVLIVYKVFADARLVLFSALNETMSLISNCSFLRQVFTRTGVNTSSKFLNASRLSTVFRLNFREKK